MLALRIIAAVLFGIWLVLAVLLSKSGFVHLLLIAGIGVEAVDLACLVRGRVSAPELSDE